MTDKVKYFKLIRIERRKHRDLDSRWKLSTVEIAEIAKELMEGEAGSSGVNKLAKKLYGSDSAQMVGRIERFRSVIKSIRDHGYVTFLEKTVEERQELFECNISHTLPRIYDGNKINDGRHRIAALLANGIEESLIAYCDYLTANERHPAPKDELKLNEDICEAAFKFIEEEQEEIENE